MLTQHDAAVSAGRAWIPEPPATRQLLQYTGAVVCGSTLPVAPTDPPLCCCCIDPAYKPPAAAPNPAVGLANQAMATGQAPSDIACLKANAWVRGKMMGQTISATGTAKASVGHNCQGGITGCCTAEGCCHTNGPLGCLDCYGQASAAAASTHATDPCGNTIWNGAAAARASGCLQGTLADGRCIFARGSASAQAEGTFMCTQGPLRC
jgi:hypothetical protein